MISLLKPYVLDILLSAKMAMLCMHNKAANIGQFD